MNQTPDFEQNQYSTKAIGVNEFSYDSIRLTKRLA